MVDGTGSTNYNTRQRRRPYMDHYGHVEGSNLVPTTNSSLGLKIDDGLTLTQNVTLAINQTTGAVGGIIKGAGSNTSIINGVGA